MKKIRQMYRASNAYILIFILFEMTIAFSGLRNYENYEKNFNANVENQLGIIVNLKIREIEHWLNELQSDAAFLYDNEVLSDIVKRYFKNPDDLKTKREIYAWLRNFHDGSNYDAVILTDPELIKKIVISDATERPQAFISPGNIDSLRKNKLVFEDFYTDESQQKIFLKILIPVLDVRQLIGIIELRIDPKTYLYPTLEDWPMPSETSETFILRRQGNEAVYLSELKFQKNAALNLRLPIEQKNLPAVRAVLVQKGFMKGIGYRGNAVVAHVGKIPNSPWYLVAQTDESEIYAPLKDKRLEMGLFYFSMILLAGIAMIVVWRRQRAQIFKERIKSAETLNKLSLAIYNSREVIFLTDKEGIITYINPQFTSLYGYTAEELIGVATPRILNSGIYKKADFESFWGTLLNKESVQTTEYFNKCKDGHLIEIEGSANPILNNNNDIIGFLGIQRDITVRKRSELEQSVNNEITNSFTHTSNINELFKLIHQSLSKILYAKNIFVALYDENTGLFSFPYWVDKFDPTPEPEAMKKSWSSYVFRIKKPVLFSPELFQQLKEQNEVELVGSPSPSWIGVPLQTSTKTIGVLVLQHYEKENIYSERDLIFLNLVGSQIAMAIEHKLAEEAIKREMDFSQNSIDSLPGLFYLFDIHGKFLRWNKNFEIITGYSAEEIKNISPLDLFDKPEKMSISEKIENIFQIGEDNIEADLLSKDKTRTPFFLTGKRFHYENTLCILGVGIDISDRKKAEEDLRNERLLLRTVIDNIPDSIYSKDTATRKTLANLTNFRNVGLKSEAEILGKTDFDFHPKELAEEFYADDQLVLQSGQPLLNKEEYVVLGNGEKKWQLTSKLPLKDKDGNIIGLVGIGRDITKRRQAEEALRESEIKLNVILQSTADGILAINSNGKIIKTNKRFAELWSIPQALIDLGDDNALIDFVLDQLINPEEFISKVQELYNSTDEDLDYLNFKDGRTFERFSAPLAMQESAVGRIWSFRDITVRLKAEEEIKLKNKELARISSEKDKFFSIIAHDLRGPFNGFLGLTQIMAEELDTLSKEELLRMANGLEKSASTLFRLLENLLQWARMQQGSIPFNPIGMQLLTFVNESIAIVMDQAKIKRIDITVDISADLSVFADDNMLQTIIRNLVSNALKFTNKGGKVTISASTGDDHNMVVAIKDTGIGMSSEMVANLFRLDVQTGRPGTDGESSSGLGLLLCKEFVEKHGGKIWVESEEGVGSTFYFTLSTNIS